MGPWRYDYFVLVKQKLLVLCVLLVGFCMPSEGANAHSGGTDKYGCHGGSRSYHCHNSGPPKEYIKHLKFNGMNARADFKVVLKRHQSCESLNNLYLRGVAVSTKAAEKELGRDTFLTLISKSLYKINRHLDTNNNGIACGFLETENFRTPTYLCGSQTELWSPLLTADDTYARCTSSDPAMGGWKIEVIGVTPDAETAILAEYHGNKPAPTGEQYFIAKLRITNLNQTSADFPDTQLGTLGTSGRKYTHFGDSCESFTDIRMYSPFSPNESRIANFCWKIKTVDAKGLVLYFERNVYTLEWTSSLTGTKFYRDSKGYSFIGMD
jgi:hypothetical protein